MPDVKPEEKVVSQKMPLIGTIEPFLPGQDFDSYEDRLSSFFLINGITEETRVPYFVSIMGAEMYQILKSLTMPVTPSLKKYDELIKILKEHFTPKVSKRVERFKFYKARQEEGEAISEFIIRLKSLAQTCKFETYLDDALADAFIPGLRKEAWQQAILNKDEDIKFSECCTVALNLEMAEKETRSMNPLKQFAIASSHRSRTFPFY